MFLFPSQDPEKDRPLVKQCKPVTRKMVAEEAGVSETIVSYVINDNRYVDAEKRRKVNAAIKKLGYRPNAIARSLKLKRSKHILFLADRIDNEHFGKLIFEMDRVLYDKGYLISLAHNRNDREFVRHVISRHFDGVIVSSISIREEYIRAIAEAGIPLVLMFNRYYRNLPAGVETIYSGLYEGAKECVRHLAGGGARNIVYVDRFSSSGDFSDESDLRFKGYFDAMAELDLPVDGESVISQCANADAVLEKLAAVLRSGRKVDGIFARNDRLAAIAIQAIKEAGLSIPRDVAVIGFDNSELSRYTHPALTTMEIDRRGVAGEAVAAIVAMIEGEKPAPASMKTTLIVRESTRS